MPEPLFEQEERFDCIRKDYEQGKSLLDGLDELVFNASLSDDYDDIEAGNLSYDEDFSGFNERGFAEFGKRDEDKPANPEPEKPPSIDVSSYGERASAQPLTKMKESKNYGQGYSSFLPDPIDDTNDTNQTADIMDNNEMTHSNETIDNNEMTHSNETIDNNEVLDIEENQPKFIAPTSYKGGYGEGYSISLDDAALPNEDAAQIKAKEELEKRIANIKAKQELEGQIKAQEKQNKQALAQENLNQQISARQELARQIEQRHEILAEKIEPVIEQKTESTADLADITTTETTTTATTTATVGAASLGAFGVINTILNKRKAQTQDDFDDDDDDFDDEDDDTTDTDDTTDDDTAETDDTTDDTTDTDDTADDTADDTQINERQEIFNALNKERKPKKPLNERLVEADDKKKTLYSALKNELLSYQKVKSRLGKIESFNAGRVQIAKISLNGASMRVYLAQKPQDYDNQIYKHKDVSQKARFALTPMMIKLSTQKDLNNIIEIVHDIMKQSGLEKRKNYAQTDYFKELLNIEQTPLARAGLKHKILPEVDSAAPSLIPDNIAEKCVEIIDGEKITKPVAQAITLEVLSERFASGTSIDIKMLKKAKLIAKNTNYLIVKGQGKLNKVFKITSNAFDMAAVKAILALGGTPIYINETK